jgi:tetratricopeptide (TPR) repeat protein
MTLSEWTSLIERVKLHGPSSVAAEVDDLIVACRTEESPRSIMHFVADVCMDMHRFMDARDILQCVNERFGLDDVGHNNLGFCLSQLGEEEEARRHWVLSISMKPDNASSLRNLALSSFAEEAILLWRRYLQLKPSDSEAYYHLIVMLFNSDRRSEAVDELQRGIAMCADKTDLLALREEIGLRAPAGQANGQDEVLE